MSGRHGGAGATAQALMLTHAVNGAESHMYGFLVHARTTALSDSGDGTVDGAIYCFNADLSPTLSAFVAGKFCDSVAGTLPLRVASLSGAFRALVPLVFAHAMNGAAKIHYGGECSALYAEFSSKAR